jgi:hypothetical protein
MLCASTTAVRAKSTGSTAFYVQPSLLAIPMIKPPEIVLGANGNDEVSGIKWTGWGNSLAYGAGIETVKHWTTSWGSSAVTRQQVKLVLSQRGHTVTDASTPAIESITASAPQHRIACPE